MRVGDHVRIFPSSTKYSQQDRDEAYGLEGVIESIDENGLMSVNASGRTFDLRSIDLVPVDECQKCPICGGDGLVPARGITLIKGIKYLSCSNCSGAGWIYVKEKWE